MTSRGWLAGASSLALAVVLAVMLWFVSTESAREFVTVRGLPRPEPLPLEFVPPDGRAPYDPTVRAVNYDVRGFADAIGELDPEGDFRAVARLDDAPTDAATHTVPVRVICGRCARLGVRVLAVDPAEVTVRLGEIVTETRSIYVDAPTVAPAGFVITRRAATPAQVTLSGAREVVQRVQRLAATVGQPVLSQGTSEVPDVPVTAQDETGATVDDVRIDPPSVAVQLTTRQRGIEISMRPEISGVEADGYYITGVSIEPQLVQLEGRSEELRTLESVGSIRVPVDVTGAAGDVVRTISLAELLPEGVTAVNADEIKVTVALTPLPGTVTLEEVPVEARGLGEGLGTPTITPDRVDILISGPRAELSALLADDVQAYIDASGLAPGRHTLPVQVSAKAGFLARSITPATVDVVISAGLATPTSVR